MFRLLLIFLFPIIQLSLNWESNFDIAKQRSIKENKIILIHFVNKSRDAKNVKLDKVLFESSDFIDYANKIKKTKNDLLDLIITLKIKGKIIVGYGASGRSTVIMNYCGINQNHIDYIVDDAVEKQGYLTPGNHIEIMTWDQMTEKCTPDYVILFAWSFLGHCIGT